MSLGPFFGSVVNRGSEAGRRGNSKANSAERRKPVTDAQRAKARELFDAGRSARDVAFWVGISYEQARTILKAQIAGRKP